MKYLLFVFIFLAAPASAASLSITHDACHWLVRHTPAPDVAYQPGVDVTGKAVAPADLAPNNIELPDTYTIPLTLDRATRLGYAPAGTEAKLSIGTITLAPTGLMLNGQPVSRETEAELAAFCRS